MSDRILIALIRALYVVHRRWHWSRKPIDRFVLWQLRRHPVVGDGVTDNWFAIQLRVEVTGKIELPDAPEGSGNRYYISKTIDL